MRNEGQNHRLAFERKARKVSLKGAVYVILVLSMCAVYTGVGFRVFVQSVSSVELS